MCPLALTLVLVAAPPLQTPHPSDAFFLPSTPVRIFHIEADDEAVAKLKAQPREYVTVTLHVDDQTFKDVGLHLKGAAGSFREWNDKPALTLNSDKFRSKQRVFGMDKFHLNNSVQDNAYVSEIVAGHLFRAAGVPSARASHAFVQLNDRPAALYVLKEGYDKTFLHHHFTDAGGNLYDGGFLQDVDARLKLDSGTDVSHKDLRALAMASRTRNLGDRHEKLRSILDLDRFVNLWVLEVLLCDWDGYTRNRNNYRIYRDPATDKFIIFAHGKDQLFQNTHEPLHHYWQGLLARRLWETPEGKALYLSAMRSMLDLHFQYEPIARLIDDYSQRLRKPLNELAPGRGDEHMRTVRQYKRRVRERIEHAREQFQVLESKLNQE